MAGTHCRRGYDYRVVGRKTNGGCRQCARDRARENYAPTKKAPALSDIFTDAAVHRIRRRVLVEGVSIDDIAEALNCSRRTIYDLIQGRRSTDQEART